MIRRRRTNLPAVLAASLALHVAGVVALLSVPEGRDFLRQVVPVRIVEREKPKPPPRRPPAKAKPGLKKATRAQARPPAAPPPPGTEAGPSFGLTVENTEGGTMEVPVGESLEVAATPSIPAPLVLDVQDEGAGSGLDVEPTPIGRLRVSYPETARLSGATGSAVIQAYVEASGFISRVELVTATAPVFGRAALEAVRQTRFRAASREGVKVACSIRVPIAFELNAAVVSAPVLVDVEPSFEATGSAIATDSQEATDSATASLPVGGTP